MAVTKIRGDRQIMDGTVRNAQIAADADIELSKLEELVLRADGVQVWTGAQDAGGFELLDIADPTTGQSAVPRDWVLTQISTISTGGFEARLATTGNVALSGTQTIDGVAGSSGDIIFVRAQTAPAENGLYEMVAGAWSRIPGMNTWEEVSGAFIVVKEGATFADTIHLITADAGGTLGTTAIASTQLPGPLDIQAGDGLTRSGQTMHVGAGDGIQSDANSVTVKLDGGTLAKGASGLKVADAGVGATQLAAGVAGAGLAGGAGSALSVNVDGATLEIDTDTVRVKAGGIGASHLAQSYIQVSKYIVRETPTGAVNGSNTSYDLANTPVAGSEMVFLNGILQEPGAGNDYTISGDTITYLTAPATGDKIRVTYLSQ